MTDFHDWLRSVLDHGKSVQDSPPSLPIRGRPEVVEVLRVAFADQVLDVAGPLVAFDPAIALEAADVLARACWSLVAGESVALELSAEPASPSAHLSADVTLRLLPGVYRRARAGDASGDLVAALDRVLRRWPLSGVLADLDGEPTTPPDFGGHPGLQLLYAERLAHTGRPGWVPADGPARQWAERVFSEVGRPLPAPLNEGTRD
ncbi:MAG TPA: hypothetical protein VM597_35760 [Gemmataceae bacterium]|jgi:hypothetical protein|nr:hypothetical protein [Gemmataceae bacterium]